MRELKHVGRVIATGKKCIVAYRTLPGDAYYCLIVPTENLPDSYHDSLINLVESNAGQEAHEFAEALARRTFSDGSVMLAALHAAGRLIKAPTSAIEMMPATGVSIVLSELNQIIAERRGIAVDELSIKPSETEQVQARVAEQPAPKDDVTRTTSGSINDVAEPVIELPKVFNTPEEQAKEYRSQADKLAKSAANFRRLAEELVPSKKKTA